MRRIIVLICALALLPAAPAAAGAAASSSDSRIAAVAAKSSDSLIAAVAAKRSDSRIAALAAKSSDSQITAVAAKKAKKKKCRKGYVRKRVKVGNRRVRRCVRKRSRRGQTVPATIPTGPTTPTTPTTTTTPTTPQPLFAAPGRELTGNEAFQHLVQYFADSTFTDCPTGWPTCGPVGERYVHCTSGAWEYHRDTPVSGSDIHSYSNLAVTGAAVHPDGSWGVEYQVPQYGAFYSWNVSATGVATGVYQHPTSGTEQLGPLAWVKLSGAC